MKGETYLIFEYKPDCFLDWWQMTQLLFPDLDPMELKEDLERIEQNTRYRTFMASKSEEIAGFITLSVRADYVEGARTSPVGYLEAIFVKTDFRAAGVARLLFEQGEAWLKDQGCVEIGSDTWLWNEAAQEFHLKLGFKKEDVLVHYIKNL